MGLFRWSEKKETHSDYMYPMQIDDNDEPNIVWDEPKQKANDAICDDTMEEIAVEVLDNMQSNVLDLVAEYISDMDEINRIKDVIVANVKFRM